MGQMLVINAPASFTAIWTIVKPWLSPRTLDKISVLGIDQHHAILRDLINPENLPTALGGTCTCDPARGGCVLSNAGPWMDDGRAARRARWLRGEIAAPGVPWPPPPPPAQKSKKAPEETDVMVEVEESCSTATTTSTPSTSWGRTSVVGLPRALPHSAVPGPVRLVV